MDIETVYLFLGVILLSSFMLVVLGKSFKNKSYEEVIAEQRQQTNALYGNQQKPKIKDKKQKKALKKSKEKKVQVHGATDDLTEEGSEHCEPGENSTTKEEVDTVEAHKPNMHVEFREPTVIDEPIKETKKEEATKKKKQQVPDKKSKHQVNEIISKSTVEKVSEVKPKEDVKEELPKEESTTVIAQNGITVVAPKDKKKKKSEINVLTQTSEKLGFNLSHFISLVRKTDMSKQDVQTLIDVLLNKQHDAPSVINEWSEGKGDPMQKLKKQLAEKSQLTTELQDTLTGTQNKLREVRAESLNERSQLMQTIRECQERLTAMKLEKQAMEHKLENLSIKCRQFQDAANEEASKNRQMIEEFTALNIQRQQVEAHIAKSHEDALTIEKLHAELANRIQQCTHDSQCINHLKDENEHLQATFENKVMVLNNEKQQLNNELQMLHEKKQQMNNELQMLHDKVRGNEKNKERELQSLQKLADDSNKEATKIKNELQMAKNDTHLIQEKLSQYVKDCAKLKEECTKLVNINNTIQQDKHKLQEELQMLQEAKANGSIEMDKQHQIVMNQLHNELTNVTKQMAQNDESNKCKLDALKKEYDYEIEELRNKNNKLITEIRNDVRDSNKKFFKRLFPSIEVSPNLSQEQWEETIEGAVQEFIRNLKTTPTLPAPTPVVKVEVDETEVAKLRLKVSNYEKIIGETEGILCKLQTHVEEEQIRWGRELQSKEDSIVLLNEKLEIKEEELRRKAESPDEKKDAN